VEQEAWDNLTLEIKELYARAKQASDPKDASALEGRVKRLLIHRARLAKQAAGKPALAVDIVRRALCAGQHWLVYCDDQSQLREVRRAISEAGVERVYEYHSAMEGDRSHTLALFQSQGGVVVSIRCLDEGVDIPDVSHALILASSRNRREFIQRRGRVLRLAPGKSLAHIHDVVVLPTRTSEELVPGEALLEGELARAIEFGEHAVNPACVSDLRALAARYGLDLETLIEEGFEQDE
jgi:superfamily II DNA or RNA helicase